MGRRRDGQQTPRQGRILLLRTFTLAIFLVGLAGISPARGILPAIPVAHAGSSPAPTGSVTFSIDGHAVGSPAAVNPTIELQGTSVTPVPSPSSGNQGAGGFANGGGPASCPAGTAAIAESGSLATGGAV